ncbi:glycosyltransferase family 4 protein [Methanospirillum stamsii]|uniref:Galactosyl transferase n=1 Tax=Methanospirillum stamsii TaxID=1277351 RepID=A0A2V2N039_9EURY|nr:glycosyltransferase family 4 protein [Methanospirillum stamsii]PWR73089.1 galactosyl transferase [Methanospirillum stamsii]
MNICVICYDFEEKNFRNQPWRYIWEIIQYFLKKDYKVTVISNKINYDLDNLELHRVNRLHNIFGPSKELSKKLLEIDPDYIITLENFVSLVKNPIYINKPIIGIFSNPIYSLKEIFNVGINEFYRHPEILYNHLISALIPRFLVKNRIKNKSCLIAMSKDTRDKLENLKLNINIHFIPPGISDFDLEIPDSKKIKNIRQEICPEKIPLIIYFTSPLTLRGTDILLKSFEKFREKIPAKLVFLSRIDNNNVILDQIRLKNSVKKSHLEGSVKFISQNLSPEDIKIYISSSDIICIPFKLVISDVPISILEAMAMGKPVISTNIACIPGLLKGKGITIDQCNPGQLSSILENYAKNPEFFLSLGKSARIFMETYPKWDDIGYMFEELFKEIEI